MDAFRLCVVIPAAGASTRFGGKSKMDADLGGRPLLHRTVELFVNRPDVHATVVAGPHDDASFAEFKLRHGDKLGLLGATLCKGGVTHRWETVKAAFEHVPEDCTHIAIHDGARPAAPEDLIDRIFKAAQTHDAVIPAIAVDDTLKRVSADADVQEEIDPLDAILGDAGKKNVTVRTVEVTIDRANLFAVQTPQVFRADLLRRAYEDPDPNATDDASQVERLGESVVVVEGDNRNIKITRPSDLRLAMAIMGLRAPKEREVHKRF
jgi:2-C-methyl-D-erythritol 4-phosphate cytidylyltransferase